VKEEEEEEKEEEENLSVTCFVYVQLYILSS